MTRGPIERSRHLQVPSPRASLDVEGGQVTRDGSVKPLFVTAATAAGWIRAMHGPHRIPTLVQRVDRLCRDAAC